MGLFKNPFKPKRKRAQVRPPSKLFLKVESIEEMVTEIAARLDAMLVAKSAAHPQEQQANGALWETFEAYSPLLAAIEQAQAEMLAEVRETGGLEMPESDYGNYGEESGYGEE